MNIYIPPSWKFGDSNPHVAFVGGFGTTPHAYHDAQKLIGKIDPLHVLDILNYSSNGFSKKITLDLYSETLANSLNSFPHIDTLVGHSLGGGICLKTLISKNHSIKKLVLINSLGVQIKPLDEIIKRNITEPNKALLKRVKLSFMPSFAQAYVNNPAYYIKTMNLALNVDLSDSLEKITIPTLIIWSTKDELFPLDVGERLHKKLPHAEFKTYNGTHNPLQTDPEAFAEYWKSEISPFIRHS